MPLTVSFGRLASDQKVGQDAPAPDSPLRVAVLGDFGGRAAREEVGGRKPRKVDAAGLDDALAKLDVALRLPIGEGGQPIDIAFRSLEDFHPDALHGRVGAFDDLGGAAEKSALMDAILHHPDFRALESCWRGLDWLLRGASRCGRVEFKLIDLSAEDLLADLDSHEDLEATGLYQILVDRPSQRGELDPWSILVGLYPFDPSDVSHAEALGRLAKVVRQASAPLLAGASPRVLEPAFAPDIEALDAWSALRALPEAALLGLVAPRFLLRTPYGEATRSIDAFDYEEAAGPDDYLWGNAALACACLLVRSFGKDGWALSPGSTLNLDGMPMHVTRDEDGDEQATLAEAWLSRTSAERLSDLGLMPLLSIRGRDAVELASIRSLARPQPGQPISPLLGRWGQAGPVDLPRSMAHSQRAAAVHMVATLPPPGSLDMESNREGVGAEAEAVEEMDPELAALMAELDAPSAAVETPSSPEESLAEEMDPELAALLGALGAEAEPAGGFEATEPAEIPREAPAVEEMDPELAALLAEFDVPDAKAGEV